MIIDFSGLKFRISGRAKYRVQAKTRPEPIGEGNALIIKKAPENSEAF